MLEPRRWQLEAREAWGKTGRGVISVVTGAGKTAFALLLFEQLRAENSALRLVVVVPTIALLDQWWVALRTECGLTESDISTYSGEGHAAAPGLANILVINTARKIAASLVGDQPCLFVVDECHRAGSPENARALVTAADFTLGLSATPVREFDDGFERYVEPALGSVVYEYDYVAALRDGIITPFDLHNFKFSMTSAETRSYEQVSRRIARAWRDTTDPRHDSVLQRLLIQRSRISADSLHRVPAAVGVAERFPGRRIVFHERINRADMIASLLDRRGERVALYHSQLDSSIRRRNLELFKVGSVTTLVTCRALDEGVNVPDAQVAVIAASTRSTRQRIQRMGRVLRRAQDKHNAAVCTLFATDVEERQLREEGERLGEIASTTWYEVSL